MSETKEVKIRINKKKLIIAIILILLLITICITFKGIKKAKVKNNNSNLGNMGLAVTDGDTVYYNKWEVGITKAKGNSDQLLTSSTAYSMNLVKDTIYYISVSDDAEIVLKSVKTNGKDEKTIKRLFTSVSKIYVQDGFIYYVNKENNLDGISRYNIDTGEVQVITTANIRDFAVLEDKIYFTDNIENLYIMDLTGINLKRIINKPMIKEFQIQGKYIYFYNTDDNNFCRCDLNGENVQVISDRIKANSNYNVTNNKIYFFDEETNTISSMDLNGKSIKELKAIKAKRTKINVVNDQIYYLDSSEDVAGQSYQIHRMNLNGSDGRKIEY